MERKTEDLAISTTELADMLKDYEGKKIYVVGDGYEVAKKALSAQGIALMQTPKLLRDQNAYSVALVGLKLHDAGKTTDDLSHLPTYLRVPQAERERLERLEKSNI